MLLISGILVSFLLYQNPLLSKSTSFNEFNSELSDWNSLPPPKQIKELISHSLNLLLEAGFIMKFNSNKDEEDRRGYIEQLHSSIYSSDSTTSDPHYTIEFNYDDNKTNNNFNNSIQPVRKLASSDIIKHKVLMEYGTPKEFDGVWHIYQDVNSTYKVRELDERNLKVELKSLKVVDKLEKAIDDTYSKQGIEYKKRLMVQGIDI